MRFSRTQKAPETTSISQFQGRVSAQQLRAFEVFDQMALDDLAMIAPHFEIERMRPGSILFDLGANDNRDYLLLDGQIDLVADDGKRTEIPAGSPRAAKAIARLRPRKFKAEVVLPSAILSIDRAALKRLLDQVQVSDEIRVFDVNDPHLSAYPFYLSMTADLSARALRWFMPSTMGDNFKRTVAAANEAALPGVLLTEPLIAARIFRCAQLIDSPVEPSGELRAALQSLDPATLREIVEVQAVRDFVNPAIAELWKERYQQSSLLAALARTLAERAHVPAPADLATRVMWTGVGELIMLCYLDADKELGRDIDSARAALTECHAEANLLMIREWGLGTRTQRLAQVRGGHPLPEDATVDEQVMQLACLHAQACDPAQPPQPWLDSPAFEVLGQSLSLSPEFSLDLIDSARSRAAVAY